MPAVPFCDSLRRYGNSLTHQLFPYRRKPTALRPYGNSQCTEVFPYRRKNPYLRRYEDSAIEIAHPPERMQIPQIQTYQTVHSGGTWQRSPSSALERNSTFTSGGNAIDRSAEKLHNTVMPDGNLHPKPSSMEQPMESWDFRWFRATATYKKRGYPKVIRVSPLRRGQRKAAGLLTLRLRASHLRLPTSGRRCRR